VIVKKVTEEQRDGQTFKIPCGHRVFVLVDKPDFEKFSQFNWRLRRSGHCFYPTRRIIRNKKAYELKLHREIMNTPQGYDCHHVNHNTLDCRRANLQNLEKINHRSIHSHFRTATHTKVPPKSM